jgi:hypothetical protein
MPHTSTKKLFPEQIPEQRLDRAELNCVPSDEEREIEYEQNESHELKERK